MGMLNGESIGGFEKKSTTKKTTNTGVPLPSSFIYIVFSIRFLDRGIVAKIGAAFYISSFISLQYNVVGKEFISVIFHNQSADKSLNSSPL